MVKRVGLRLVAALVKFNNTNKDKKKNNSVKPQKKQKASNNNRAQKQMAPETARTIGGIITTLGTQMKGMNMTGNEYMACRLAAMPPRSATSIPDGKGGMHINTCYWTTNTISCGSGGINWNLYLVPWLPSPLLINGNTAGNVDGIVVPSSSTNAVSGFGCPPALFTSTGLPISVWTTAPGKVSVNPNNATTMRFGSIGLRLRYTGPASTCAGTIRVTKFPMTLGNPSVTTTTSSSPTPPSTGIFMDQTSRAGAIQNSVDVDTKVYDMNPSLVQSQAPTCGVQFFRPEQGLAARLSHKGTEFKSVPWFDNYVGVANSSTKGTNANQLNNLFYASYNDQVNTQGGVCAFDNDWEPICITIMNANADASFIVETCVCCEITPSMTSQFYPLARESKATNKSTLTQTESILNKQGPAVPLNQVPR